MSWVGVLIVSFLFDGIYWYVYPDPSLLGIVLLNLVIGAILMAAWLISLGRW